MKKRLAAFASALVLIMTMFSTQVMAATQTEVDTEINQTATYLAGELSGNLTIDKYRQVFLIGASTIDASSLITEYVNLVKATPSTSLNISQYGGIIMALKASGIDPTNLDGRNLVTEFSTALNDPANSTFFTGYYGLGDSPYKLVYILSSLNGYKESIINSNTHMTACKDALLDFYDSVNSYFDYWGGTADTDSKVIVGLKPFYDTSDSEIVTITNTAITSIKTTIDSNFQSISCGGTSTYPDPFFMSGANPSSTGLVLLALSTFGDSDVDNIYTGLIGFKVAATPGAYHSAWTNDPDPEYSTPDALEGLLAYSRYLSQGSSIYDLTSYTVAGAVETQVTPQTTVQNAPQTGDATPYIFFILLISAAGVFGITLRKKLRNI